MPPRLVRPDASTIATAGTWWHSRYVPVHARTGSAAAAAATTAADPSRAVGRRSLAALFAAWLRLAPFEPAPSAPATPRQRAAVAVVALVVVAAVIASALLGWRPGLALSSVLFFAFALGAAPALTLRLPDVSSLVLASIALALSGAVLGGLLMASTGTWAPVTAVLWCVVASAAWLGAHLWRDLRRARQETVPAALPDRVQLVTAGLVVAGLVVSSADAWAHRGPAVPGGLLASVGPWWFVGVALVLASAVLALLRGGPSAMALPALALSVPVVASQAVVYGAPTVMAAARHVGVVEFIRSYHALAPSRDIYQSWAGLFAGAAWLADVGRIADPLTSIATYWPVLSNVITVLAVRCLAGRLGLGPRRAWSAGAVFMLGNTLNTTYFSPQALGIFLSVTVLALVLGRPATAPAEGARTRWAALRGEGARSTGALVLAVLVIASTLAVSHQISPYLLLVAMGVLFCFRVLRSWWSMVAVALPAAVWAVVNIRWVTAYTTPGAFGDLFGNLRPPAAAFIGFPQPLSTRITFDVPAAALVLIGLTAIAAWWLRRDRLGWALALCAGSPLALAVGSDYGQEAIFRIALFALPWLSVLALRLPLRDGAVRRAATPLAAAAVVVLFAANAVGATGMDWARVIDRTTAEQARTLELTAASGAVVFSPGTGNATPARMTQRYFDVTYTVVNYYAEDAIITADPATQAEADEQVAAWTASVRPGCAAGCYLVQADTINAYLERYGIQPLAAGARISDAFAASPSWEALYVGPTSTTYRLVPAAVTG